ncbi:MAG TPA: extracellular solute-binding protein [Thermomicrobiales bacterium]|nr:extracellular solute-binding protein [Thermomicrobiales bacterium]
MIRLPRRFLSLAMVMLMSLGMIGWYVPTTGAQDQIELRVWDQFTDPAESDTADKIYSDFTAANPNIKITREAYSTDQMRQTVNTALSSGTGPDIIFYDAGPGYAGVLANAGLLAPLDQYSQQYGWKDRIAPSSLEATSLGGKLYGLPLQVDLIGMYYNQGLFDKEGMTVPQTLDDLVNFCKQAKDKGYTPFAFADNEGWEAFHQFSMTANQMIGPDAMRNLLVNNQGSWNSPEIVTAIKSYFVDLRDAGCFSKDVNALKYDDGNSLFYSEQAMVHSTGSWLANQITENMPDADIRFMPFPQLPGAKDRVWVSGVGSAYYITSGSKNQDAAAKFLDFLFSPDIVSRWVSEANFIVPVQFDTSTVQVSPLFKSILDTLQQASQQGTLFGYNVDVLAPPQFNDVMTNGFQAMLAGDKTPEQQAADLDAAWKEGMQGQGTPQATPGS